MRGPALHQFVIPGRVKIITIPAGIGKIREPFPGNKTGLVIEELAVSHFPGRGDDLAPYPGVLFRIAGPPEQRRYMFLRGKARHLIGKEGKKSDFVYPVDQLSPGTDPVRIIPVEAFHNPCAAFIGH